ncbi:MAG: hypothetical protein DBY14_01950 [Escherichia coli]|nr:MAG: hypothetical protein DBY14_01950 [Escherichia coli]
MKNKKFYIVTTVVFIVAIAVFYLVCNFMVGMDVVQSSKLFTKIYYYFPSNLILVFMVIYLVKNLLKNRENNFSKEKK